MSSDSFAMGAKKCYSIKLGSDKTMEKIMEGFAELCSLTFLIAQISAGARSTEYLLRITQRIKMLYLHKRPHC